jgi:hypothetical protein
MKPRKLLRMSWKMTVYFSLHNFATEVTLAEDISKQLLMAGLKRS